MPTIIDYDQVLTRMRELGFRSAYYNSGAFAFAPGVRQRIVGWLGPDDPTIRPDLQATIVRVRAPYASNLTDRFLTIWPEHIAGPAWVVPKSHWSFELDHGSRAWLPDLVRSGGVDPSKLETLTNAAAIAFEPPEIDSLRQLLEGLLERLSVSDFAILFPQWQGLVTVHHHQQLWWQVDEALDATGVVNALVDPV